MLFNCYRASHSSTPFLPDNPTSATSMTTMTAVTPQTPGHKRSATAIIRSLVSPHKSPSKSPQKSPPKSPGKKSSSYFSSSGPSNPLNNYMVTGSMAPPQLPELSLDNSSFLPPLEPPNPPFAQKPSGKMHKRSLSSLSISSFTSRKDKSVPPSPTRGSLDVRGGTVFDLINNFNKVAEQSSAQNTGRFGGQKKPNKARSTIDFSILRMNKKSSVDIKGLSRDKENQRPPPELTPSTSTSSGFSNDTGSIGGLHLFSLPQDHPHSQSKKPPPVPFKDRSPRITPSSSNTSLQRSLLPAAPIEQQPRASLSSSSSSISAKQERASTEELVRKYTPNEYTPSSQRNFFGQYEPNLTRKPVNGSTGSGSSSGKPKQRPKSAYVPPSASLLSGGFSVASPRKGSYELRHSMEKKRSEDGRKSPTGSQGSRGSQGSQGSAKSAKSSHNAGLDLEGIDVAFEALLDSRGVPENLRDRMRKLDIRVKQEFIRKEAQMEKTAEKAVAVPTSSGLFGRRPQTAHGGRSETRPKSKEGTKSLDAPPSPTKKARPRSRTFGASKDKDSSAPTFLGSPKKQKSSDSGPTGDKSLRVKGIVFPPTSTSAIPGNGSTSPTMVPTLGPQEWAEWLRDAARPKIKGHKMFVEDIHGKGIGGEQGMKDVEVSILHKLRLVLRNERLRWVEKFVELGGMQAIWSVLERVLRIEWREEHEDLLLHELLLCLKALCTASLALEKLLEMENIVFPRLIELLFDEEKKGPSEFTTRGLIINLLFTHLSTAPQAQKPERTKRILGYLADKVPSEDQRPVEFIEVAHTRRPYKRWCKEVSNITKEVFWIFLHGANVIALPGSSSNHSQDRDYTYCTLYFPAERPPVPAAPYVGGVEWEATNYLANHMDLLNGCIASLETREERNNFRLDLRNSGWEKLMGGSLRTCKERLHTALHEGLKTWVAAAVADEWEICDVRFGPRIEHYTRDTQKEAKKERRRKKEQQREQEELKLQLPKLDFASGGVAAGGKSRNDNSTDGGWLY